MPLLRLQPRAPKYSCDGRFIFIQLLSNGETRINGQVIAQNKLAPLVHSIMKPRAERVVYLVPDALIGYDRFVTSLSTLQNAATDLHIAVLSGKLRNEYFERRLEPCDIAWPVKEMPML